jgi:formamidopyrimidine-DNA glycosylase
VPELPDVELRRRYLDATALQRRVDHAMVPESRVLEGSADHLRRSLNGRRLVGSRRHGKHLFARLDDGSWLTLHFGMTGRLVAFASLGDEPEHCWLRLDLNDGMHLAYVCPRQLGHVGACSDADEYVADHDLGPDALDLGEDVFLQRLEGRRGQVKLTLMNQRVLAGLGNVWTDEVLFQDGLHPTTPIPDLDEARRLQLFRTMHRVLAEGVERGADPERMPDTWLLGHRDEGARCPRCGGEIQRVEVSGRAGYLCPEHQERPGG